MHSVLNRHPQNFKTFVDQCENRISDTASNRLLFMLQVLEAQSSNFRVKTV